WLLGCDDGRLLVKLQWLCVVLGVLYRHLVRQLGHGDGFGHMDLDLLELGGRDEGAGTVAAVAVATPPLRAGAPVAAARGGVAAGLDFLLLGRVVLPGRRQILRLDFLLAGGRRGSTRRLGSGGTRGGFVQRALGLGVGRRLGFLGHERARRRSHHGADAGRLGLGLAAALFQIAGPLFFLPLGLRVVVRLGLGRCGTLLGSGLGLGLLFGLPCLLGGGLLGLRLLGPGPFGFRGRLGLLAGTLLCLAGFLGLALAALLRQFFFLTAQQLGLTAGLFLTAGELGGIDHRRGRGSALGCLLDGRRSRCLILALDEGALLAHFHLDRAGTACGIGLLDLGGGLLGQRDLAALGSGRAMAGLEVVQQRLLVGFGHRIGAGVFAHASGRQLFQQDSRRFVQFSGQFGNGGGTCHEYLSSSATQADAASSPENQCARA